MVAFFQTSTALMAVAMFPLVHSLLHSHSMRKAQSYSSLSLQANAQRDSDFSKDDSSTTDDFSVNRRSALIHAVTAGVSGTLSVMNPSSATARDELFQKNPLTNPLLEQVRIWEQAEADELKYGGELERGDAAKLQSNSYPKLLVPILVIAHDLQTMQSLAQQTVAEGKSKDEVMPLLKDLQALLQQGRYEKVAFKKVFNSFGDNIYYSDPDRANLYLGGGATPKNSQSIAYMQRNEILTNLEDMQAEVAYLLKEQSTDTQDLLQMANKAQTAMKEYLAVVPPNELDEAQKLIAASS